MSDFPILGAVYDGQATTFRVWAPARAVAVMVEDETHELQTTTGGVHELTLAVPPGTDYDFVLDGGERLPDPWSRWQPDGLHGPSRVLRLDPPTAGPSLELEQLVIYELHVGTFTEPGTFDAAVEHFEALRDLGITAVEVMPIATFPGEHGWGYDGVYSYAPHPAYGGPQPFKRLVDAAHDLGLAVILDVVYNHVGAGSDAITAFAPYLTDRHETFWGDAIDYTRRGVREWAIQNAEMWVRDYGVDGLRLDAVHSIFDESETHVLTELAERVKAIRPQVWLIDEMEIGDLRPIEEWGHDAQWGDGLHHAVHVLLTGEQEGYYAGYGRVADLARELQDLHIPRFVVCAQNHDQVGNRPLGDRLRGADLRLAAFCSLLSPGIPMLFQGEEYDESHPFQYFTDHTDLKIARLTREGRRREFADFSGFDAPDVPDPQDPETFRRSKLDRSAADPEHLEYYRELIALRRELGQAPIERLEVDEPRRLLSFHRGGVDVIANFGDSEQEGVPARSGVVRR
ncbi:MAG TPA: alpha-amylase family glycosyl hydrolase [Solirubrobacteraceae bacterium]|nr:alpha-amylase family glycosyl hydrolase [Solirubrobacteraceae bacterium]